MKSCNHCTFISPFCRGFIFFITYCAIWSHVVAYSSLIQGIYLLRLQYALHGCTPWLGVKCCVILLQKGRADLMFSIMKEKELADINGLQIRIHIRITWGFAHCFLIKNSQPHLKNIESKSTRVCPGICFYEGDLGQNHIWEPLKVTDSEISYNFVNLPSFYAFYFYFIFNHYKCTYS